MKLDRHRAVEALRAAGEPTRLRILALLRREELAVLEITQVLGQSQPRVSRHLRVLTDAGLVERFADGAWAFYRLTDSQPARGFLDGLLGGVEDGAVDAEDAERLRAVVSARDAAAAAYFARSAARWDEIRSLYVAEAAVEAAVREAVGFGPFGRVVDLGTGTGRMLALAAPLARAAVGIDLSQQMLNIARRNVSEAGLPQVELRHGDIHATRLPGGEADLVIVHQVLHYLADPGAALAEAARLVAPGGRLLLVDFAPHALEFLREAHAHRRLGFADDEMVRWLSAAGLESTEPVALPPGREGGLTVKIWTATRAAAALPERIAA